MDPKDRFQKLFIEHNLKFFYGDVAATAKHINVTTKHLYNRIHDLSIDLKSIQAERGTKVWTP